MEIALCLKTMKSYNCSLNCSVHDMEKKVPLR